MPALTKTVTVLDFIGVDAEGMPIYCALGDETRSHAVAVDPDVWEDMGRPDAITVTIEPGDLLNEAAA